MIIWEVPLLEFLGEPDARFAVPRYQRAYSWEADQCDELWRDLFRAARARRSHFAGALIYANEREGAAAERSVVDGQQRLTTVSLIIAAMADYLRERGESLFGMGADDLKVAYLRAGDAPKLELSHADNDTLAAIALDRPLPANPSKRVCENLACFAAHMREENFDAAELWQGLNALTVIAIALDRREKAPEVFESLNSKGVPLVTADLVRNYLLLAESHREQARLYETCWQPIQGVFGDDPGSIRLNNAIMGWLAVRFRKIRKLGDAQAFSTFKSFCEDEYEGTVDALLDELYAFCMVWAENYRYHSVKKYKSADWAKLGRKTRVSDRPLAKLDNPESLEYYQRHFGVDPQW
ncbi:MAG: DUF262 domain-containing protein [Eggerthellaceae bacterium]|nr:DUF262 domain-containing protein [Eggerthellaceae bacterium]